MKWLALSRHAISACHVTRQRQMELDGMTVFDAPLCQAGERQLRERCGVTSA